MLIQKRMPEEIPTPAEILEQVERPRSILRAEEKLQTLREIRDSLAVMAEAFKGSPPGLPMTQMEREVIENQRQNAEQLVEARQELADATADYEGQLRATVKDRRAAASESLRRAFDDLLDAWSSLDHLDGVLCQTAGHSIVKRRPSAKRVEPLFRKLINDRLEQPA